MALKLTYFSLPGRGETSRLMLASSGKAFEDVRIPFAQWPEHKASTPFGYVPVLEHDGKKLSESVAIDHYVAKMTGFYPDDAWSAALADQFYALVAFGVWKIFEPSFAIKDIEEKIKARKDICEGPLKLPMGNVTKALESKSTEFIAGNKPSFADIFFFVQMSSLISGWLDGVPRNLLDDYPTIKAHRNKVANLPGVKAYYEKETEGVRVAFKPDA